MVKYMISIAPSPSKQIVNSPVYIHVQFKVIIMKYVTHLTEQSGPMAANTTLLKEIDLSIYRCDTLAETEGVR